MLRNHRYISAVQIGEFVIIFITLQMCVWYGGLKDLIPIGLLKYWNILQMGMTLSACLFCVTKRYKISIVTIVLILYKASLLFSTILNGREINVVEFFRFWGLIILIEIYAKDIKILTNALMLIFEIMIYYNLYTCIINGPDIFGAYYGALGYDNGFPPYLLSAFFVLIIYYGQNKKIIRPMILLMAIHLTVFITFSATGIVGLLAVDILLVFNWIKRIKLSLFQSYLMLLAVEVMVVIFRLQNKFSYLIVNLLGKDLTFTGRTKDWDAAMMIIPQKIFWGYGNIDQATEKVILGDVFCHNGILEQLFRGGIIYFLIFSLAVALISKRIRRVDDSIIQNCIFVICGFWILSITEVVLEGTMLSLDLALLYAVTKSIGDE